MQCEARVRSLVKEKKKKNTHSASPCLFSHSITNILSVSLYKRNNCVSQTTKSPSLISLSSFFAIYLYLPNLHPLCTCYTPFFSVRITLLDTTNSLLPLASPSTNNATWCLRLHWCRPRLLCLSPGSPNVSMRWRQHPPRFASCPLHRPRPSRRPSSDFTCIRRPSATSRS